MTKIGIDVSKHQGNIDWQQAKGDINFAILRAGYGREISQKDPTFETNYKGCKDNNIPVGVYWYSYAMTADEARKEAEVCLQVIKGKTFEYPIYFDIEEAKQFALGRAKCTEITQAFLDKVEKAGYWVGIYSSKSSLEAYLSEDIRSRYAVWVAHYGVKKTNYSGVYGIWQKSSTGRIKGVNGNVDIDECYVDYPTQIKKAGLNGLKAGTPAPTTEEKPKTEAKKETKAETKTPSGYTEYIVKKGDTLWDIARSKLKNGSRYTEIKKINGLKSDTIYAGQKLKIPKI